jgi:hypothetical protein
MDSGCFAHNILQLLHLDCTRCFVAGCSVASLSRSQVTLNPETSAGLELSDWWMNEGSALEPVAVGAHLANARGAGQGWVMLHKL